MGQGDEAPQSNIGIHCVCMSVHACGHIFAFRTSETYIMIYQGKRHKGERDRAISPAGLTYSSCVRDLHNESCNILCNVGVYFVLCNVVRNRLPNALTLESNSSKEKGLTK